MNTSVVFFLLSFHISSVVVFISISILFYLLHTKIDCEKEWRIGVVPESQVESYMVVFIIKQAFFYLFLYGTMH